MSQALENYTVLLRGKLLQRYGFVGNPKEKTKEDLKEERKDKLLLVKDDTCKPDDPESIYVLNYGGDISREGIRYRDDMWRCFVKGGEKLTRESLMHMTQNQTPLLAEENDIIIKPIYPVDAVYIDKETAEKGILVSSAFFIVKLSDTMMRKFHEENRKILSKYLYACLRLACDAVNDHPSMLTGETVKRIDGKYLSSIMIPIDLTSENSLQQMQKVNEILAKSDEVIHTLEEIKAAELHRVRAIILGNDQHGQPQKEGCGDNNE